MIPSCSMFAESVTSSILDSKQWSVRLTGNPLVNFSLYKLLDILQNIILCSFKVYLAFPLPASKCFLRVLPPQIALNLNRSLKLPLLKLLVVFLSLWPLKPIPCLPQNSKHLIKYIKISLFSSNFSLFFSRFCNLKTFSWIVRCPHEFV